MRNIRIPWRINEQIKAVKLRVISSDGKQVGVLDTIEARKLAKEEGVDLIEIAPKANPPVAKIAELGKYIYQEEKKKKKEAKKNKGSELKEIRFSPFIAENDYNTRVERIKEFLRDKNKVKLTVVFKGRQLGSKSFGYELLGKVTRGLGDSIHVDSEPKFFGRHLNMIISPRAGGSSAGAKEKENAKTENKKISNKEVQSN